MLFGPNLRSLPRPNHPAMGLHNKRPFLKALAWRETLGDRVCSQQMFASPLGVLSLWHPSSQ
jgi:hypothetical protein